MGAKGKSSEYNASDGPQISYQGGGGVPLSSFMTRLAFAVNYKQTNFVLNNVASGNGAHIIFDRDPRVMVQKVAPFLKVDGDPYPIVHRAERRHRVDGRRIHHHGRFPVLAANRCRR